MNLRTSDPTSRCHAHRSCDLPGGPDPKGGRPWLLPACRLSELLRSRHGEDLVASGYWAHLALNNSFAETFFGELNILHEAHLILEWVSIGLDG